MTVIRVERVEVAAEDPDRWVAWLLGVIADQLGGGVAVNLAEAYRPEGVP